MKAIFLGTADGHSSATRQHSGILLLGEKTSLLLESGASVATYLKNKNIDPNIPDGVWLSHMHSDHVGHFSMLIQSLWLRQRKAPLHVYGPGSALADIELWLKKTILFPELIGFPIVWHALKDGQAETLGTFTLTPFSTNHLDSLASMFKEKYPETSFECYGTRIEENGIAYVHSADIALPPEMRPALRGPIKSLLCEFTHFPPELLFEELAQHQIETVWLTHYPDKFAGQENEFRQQAKNKGFKGQLHLVYDQSEHEI